MRALKAAHEEIDAADALARMSETRTAYWASADDWRDVTRRAGRRPDPADDTGTLEGL